MNRQVQSNPEAFKIRSAVRDDATQVSRIYGFHVSEGAGTFEEVAPTAEEVNRRMQNVSARRLPWKVAETCNGVVGYCYASPFHSRSAYRFSVQSSVYVDREWHGRGIGLALLNSVIESCRELGYCQVMAAVGDGRNEAALRLHARAGFRTVGHAVRVGMKFGRWMDVVYLQKSLHDPGEPPPETDPVGYIPSSDQTGP